MYICVYICMYSIIYFFLIAPAAAATPASNYNPFTAG